VLGNTATDVVLSRLRLSSLHGTEVLQRISAHRSTSHGARANDDSITPPFVDDKRKAAKVIRLLGYDVAFIGAVADYQYDGVKKQITVTVDGVLLEATKDAVGYRVTKNRVGFINRQRWGCG